MSSLSRNYNSQGSARSRGGAGLPGSDSREDVMAEGPRSPYRSLYKLVGSPPWKEAFRQVSVGFRKAWLGGRHYPGPSQEPLYLSSPQLNG